MVQCNFTGMKLANKKKPLGNDCNLNESKLEIRLVTGCCQQLNNETKYIKNAIPVSSFNVSASSLLNEWSSRSG